MSTKSFKFSKSSKKYQPLDVFGSDSNSKQSKSKERKPLIDRKYLLANCARINTLSKEEFNFNQKRMEEEAKQKKLDEEAEMKKNFMEKIFDAVRAAETLVCSIYDINYKISQDAKSKIINLLKTECYMTDSYRMTFEEFHIRFKDQSVPKYILVSRILNELINQIEKPIILGAFTSKDEFDQLYKIYSDLLDEFRSSLVCNQVDEINKVDDFDYIRQCYSGDQKRYTEYILDFFYRPKLKERFVETFKRQHQHNQQRKKDFAEGKITKLVKIKFPLVSEIDKMIMNNFSTFKIFVEAGLVPKKYCCSNELLHNIVDQFMNYDTDGWVFYKELDKNIHINTLKQIIQFYIYMESDTELMKMQSWLTYREIFKNRLKQLIDGLSKLDTDNWFSSGQKKELKVFIDFETKFKKN